MKLPTKAQWDEIAEKVEFDNPGNYNGLCQIFDEMGFNRDLCKFHDFLSPFKPKRLAMSIENNFWGYWWNKDNAGMRQRAFFCCMMAAITEAGDMESLIEEA